MKIDMFSGFKLPGQKESEICLTLDLGSEAAKAIVFKVQEGKRIILGSSLEYMDEFGVWNAHDGQLDFRAKVIRKFAIKTAKGAIEMCKKNPVSFFIAPPPNVLQVRIVKTSTVRSDRNRHISVSEEGEIWARAHKEAKYAISKAANMAPENIFFFPPRTISVKIDGYKVKALRNFNGKNITADVLVIFIIKKYLDKNNFPIFLSGFQKEIGIKFREVRLLHAAQGIANLSKFLPDALLLDVGGKFTQIFIIKDASLVFADKFEMGGSDFSLKIAETMGLGLAEARMLQEQYCLGNLTASVAERLRQEFSPLALAWFTALKNKLAMDVPVVPSIILMAGGGALQPDIKKVLEHGNWENLPIALKHLRPLNVTDLPHLEGFKAQMFFSHYAPSLLLCYGHDS